MNRSLHWAEIDRLVLAHHREDPTSSLQALERYLRKWWCMTYNRPFKDPLLEQYTLDELAYEFLTKHYLNPENDPDKKAEVTQRAQEDDDWAAKMVEQEVKRLEAATRQIAQATEDIGKSSKSKGKKAKSAKKELDPASFPDVISTKFDVPEE